MGREWFQIETNINMHVTYVCAVCPFPFTWMTDYDRALHRIHWWLCLVVCDLYENGKHNWHGKSQYNCSNVLSLFFFFYVFFRLLQGDQFSNQQCTNTKKIVDANKTKQNKKNSNKMCLVLNESLMYIKQIIFLILNSYQVNL